MLSAIEKIVAIVISWIKVVFGVKTYISLFVFLLLTIKAKS
jgi:hypothetical protein